MTAPDPELDAPPAADPAPRATPFRRQVLVNSAAAVLANGWTIVLSLVALPLILHGLGRTAFGVWALLQTFSALTGWFSLADAGVGIATTRAVADRAADDDPDGVARSAGSGIAAMTALAAVGAVAFTAVGALAFSSVFRVPDSLQHEVRIALVAFGVQIVADMVASAMGFCLDGLQRIDLSRALDSLRRTLIIGASVVASLSGSGIGGVVSASAGAAVGSAVIYGLVLRRQLQAPLRADRATARTLLHYGRRVWLLSGTGVIHRTMDRMIVGVFLGPASVALAEIATQVQNGVAAVLGASSYSATSTAAWVRGRSDPARLRELLVRGTKYTCLATVPLCALVGTLAGPLVRAWVGPEYASAGPLLALAVVYLATQAPLAVGSNLLVGIGEAGAVIRPAIVAVAVNAAVSVLLIHRYGVIGGFIGTIVSGLVLTPYLARVIGHQTGVGPAALFRRGVLPCLAPALAAAAVAVAVRAATMGPLPTAVVGLGAGGVAWVVVAVGVSLNATERAELLGLVRRAR